MAIEDEYGLPPQLAWPPPEFEPAAPAEPEVWPPPEWADTVPPEAMQPAPTQEAAAPEDDLGVALGFDPAPTGAGDLSLGRAELDPPFAQPRVEQQRLPGAAIDDDLGVELGLVPPQPIDMAPDVAPATIPEITEGMGDEERTQFLAEDITPEAFMAEQVRSAQAEDQHRRALAMDAQTKADEAIAEASVAREKARADFATKQAAHQQRVEQLMAQREDPGRWWESRSSGQRIAAYISAAIGGFLTAGRGPNQALEMFSKEIDRDIASQRSDLQRQQQLLGMQGQQLGAEGAAIDDDFWDSVKIARMHAVSEQAQAQLAQLDPRGTAAINGAALVREQQARTAQAEAALMDKQLTQSQEAAEFDLKRRKQEMNERNVASQIAEREAKMRPQGGGGKAAGAGLGADPETGIVISGKSIFGVVDAQGNDVPITIDDRQTREDLKGRYRNVKSAHRVLTELNKLGGIQREWKLGSLTSAQRARAEQLVLGQILQEAKSMGGTITEGDIEFQGKRIPRDPQKLLQNMGATRALFDGYYDDTVAGLQGEIEIVTGRKDLRMRLPAKPKPVSLTEKIQKATADRVYDPETGKAEPKSLEQKSSEIAELPTEIHKAVQAGEMTPEQGAAELREAAEAEDDEATKAALLTGAKILESPGATVSGPGYGVEDLPEYRKETKAAQQSTARSVQQAREDRKERPLFDDEVRGKLPGGGK